MACWLTISFAPSFTDWLGLNFLTSLEPVGTNRTSGGAEIARLPRGFIFVLRSNSPPPNCGAAEGGTGIKPPTDFFVLQGEPAMQHAEYVCSVDGRI
jgi:hypothetical protein